ncbi:MAG: DUF488 domain-containing protein [Paludibacteraceae bacterium]|nr:DUF488 domain-containing protein [Paludibacteraceae bacterium]
MKIYTSYFSRIAQVRKAGVLPVSIALWSPRWYDGDRFLELAPLRYMLKEDLTNEEYTRHYHAKVLSKFDANGLRDILARRFNGRDIALMCYEKPNDFCHRHLVREWLNKNGVECAEFGEPNENAEEKKPEPIQQTLFDI